MQTKALILQVPCFTSVEFHWCSGEITVLTEISVFRDAGKFMSCFHDSFHLLLLKECLEYVFASLIGMN